jgi:hypothetical protein
VETCAAGEGRVPNRRDKPVQRAPSGPSKGSPPGPSGGSSSNAEQGIAAGADRWPVLCGTTGRGSLPPIRDRPDAVTMRNGTQLSTNLPKLPSYLIILKYDNILPLSKIPLSIKGLDLSIFLWYLSSITHCKTPPILSKQN